MLHSQAPKPHVSRQLSKIRSNRTQGLMRGSASARVSWADYQRTVPTGSTDELCCAETHPVSLSRAQSAGWVLNSEFVQAP